MYTGIIVENSLINKGILSNILVLKSWQDGAWILHKVSATEDQINQIARLLEEGPWYVHFWDSLEENIIVVFKNKTFSIDAKNKETWQDAITYGVNTGIPLQQLDFLINQDS